MRKLLGGFLAVLLLLAVWPVGVFAQPEEETDALTGLLPAAMPATREYPALLPSFDASWYTRANQRVMHSKYDFFFLAEEEHSGLSTYYDSDYVLYYGWNGSLYPIAQNVTSLCGGWGGTMYYTQFDPDTDYAPDGFSLVRYNPVTGSKETVMENVYRAYIGPETRGLLYYTVTHPDEQAYIGYRYEVRCRNLATGQDWHVFEDEGNDALYEGETDMALFMSFTAYEGKLFADVYYPYDSEAPLTRTLWLDAPTGEILGDSLDLYREKETLEEKITLWNMGAYAEWDTRYEAWEMYFEFPARGYAAGYDSWEAEQEQVYARLKKQDDSYIFAATSEKEAEALEGSGNVYGATTMQCGPFFFGSTKNKYHFIFDLNQQQIYVVNPDDNIDIYAAPGWRVG